MGLEEGYCRPSRQPKEQLHGRENCSKTSSVNEEERGTESEHNEYNFPTLVLIRRVNEGGIGKMMKTTRVKTFNLHKREEKLLSKHYFFFFLLNARS